MSRFFSFTILSDLFSCFFFRNLPCLCCLLFLAFYVLLCYLNLHWPSIFLLNNRLFYVFLFWLFYSSNKKTHTQKYKAKCLYKGCFPILYKVIISLLSFFFFFSFFISHLLLFTLKLHAKSRNFGRIVSNQQNCYAGIVMLNQIVVHILYTCFMFLNWIWSTIKKMAAISMTPLNKTNVNSLPLKSFFTLRMVGVFINVWLNLVLLLPSFSWSK